MQSTFDTPTHAAGIDAGASRHRSDDRHNLGRVGRLLVILLALGLVAATAAGCDSGEATAEDQIAVRIFGPGAVGLPVTPTPIQNLRVTVRDSVGSEVSSVLVPVGSDEGVGSAPEIPFAEGLQIYVEGLDSSSNTVAYGGTPPFDVIDPDTPPRSFFVFVTPVGAVSPLAAIFQGDQVLPSPSVHPRAGHTATALPDGRVLLIGGSTLVAAGAGVGQTNVGEMHATIEVFNPSLGYFDPAPSSTGGQLSLNTPRVKHDAILLDDGRVVVIGGLAEESGALASTSSVEIITPNPDGTFTITEGPSLNQPRVRMASVKRNNGDVLVTGGVNATPSGSLLYHASVELLDVDAGLWVPFDGMGDARAGHTATDLGTVVLMIGGENNTEVLSSVEIFTDGDGSRFVAFPPMDSPRHEHAAIQLSKDNGRYVLVSGGFTQPGVNVTSPVSVETPTFDVELFNKDDGVWQTDPSTVGMIRQRAHHELIEIANGGVVAIGGFGHPEGNAPTGGLASVEVLSEGTSPTLYQASLLPTTMAEGRLDIASVRLSTGLIMMTGGTRLQGGGFAAHNQSDVLNPGPP